MNRYFLLPFKCSRHNAYLHTPGVCYVLHIFSSGNVRYSNIPSFIEFYYISVRQCLEYVRHKIIMKDQNIIHYLVQFCSIF